MPKSIKKLKIAYVLDDGLDRPDGVQQYVLTLGRWMASRGHEVHFLVGETSRNDIANIHSLAKNIRVQFNGNGLTVPLPASKKKIQKLLALEKYDVLHVQVPYSPLMAGKVVKFGHDHSVVVGTFHILPFGLISKIGTRLLGIYLSRNIRLFDMNLAVSEPARLFARTSFRIETTVVPNAVDLRHYRKQVNDSEARDTRIVYLGRLVERKGAKYLLIALNHLVSTGQTSFHLSVYGKGPDLTKLQKYVSSNGLDRFVTLYGYIDENDKPEALSRADIAVFPSLAGESFGIVMIEAIASGSGVVVGGDNPGYRSVLQDEATLVNPRDCKRFARLINTYITNLEYRAKKHAYQQELVKRYDIEVVGNTIERAYYSCMTEKFKS